MPGPRYWLEAVPTFVPRSMRTLPFMPEINPPLDCFCRVALRIASPPKDAVVGETVNVEGPACAVMAMVAVAELFGRVRINCGFVSDAEGIAERCSIQKACAGCGDNRYGFNLTAG